jgi:ABC-type multidrug transport system fused ATPase/permease subunit
MMSTETSQGRQRICDLLWALSQPLTSANLAGIAAYVCLSLASACAGGIAALSLASMVEPGQTMGLAIPFSGISADIEMQAGIFAMATACFAFLRWQTSRVGARLVSRYAMSLRRIAHAHLIDTQISLLADSTSPEIANVLTYNIEIIIQGFNALLQLLIIGITTIISLGMAFWVVPRLMLATPLCLFFGWLAARAYSREQSRVSHRYVADMTRLFWLSEDFPRRLRHVRSFEREDAEKAGYDAISTRLGEGYRRQLELVASGRLVLEMLAALGIALMFVLAHRWHGIDQVSLIAVSLLLGRLVPYLVSTRQSFQQVRSAAPALELWRRYTCLDSIRSRQERPPISASGQALHIDHMVTALPNGLDVDDISLVPGEMTLISGDSGIGKSRLVDVLAGMATPRDFRARFGDRPIDFRDYCELVRNGAYVCQSVRPWHNTVRECLLWVDPDAGDEILWSALTEVGLDSKLSGSGDGLDTALSGPSSRLSGGELQRLLLAQVILRRPFLALLDEATNALDVQSEMAVLSALKRRLPQTALIVVSHRTSVASIADQWLTIKSDLAVATTTRRNNMATVAKHRYIHSAV